MRNAYKILVGIPGKEETIWEGVKMDLKERGYENVDWIRLAQDRK
jgi:hypothetical protein